MIFQHTLPQVLDGSKTQTRRIITANHEAIRDDEGRITTVLSGGRTRWQVGKTYAVQPGRGQPQVARIRIMAIERQRASDISDEAAQEEGSTDREDFLSLWTRLHGEAARDADAWVITFELTEILNNP